MDKNNASSQETGDQDCQRDAESTVTPVVSNSATVVGCGTAPSKGYRRLTVNVRRDLHKKIKLIAIYEDRTIGELISEFIERYQIRGTDRPWGAGK